MSRPPLLRTGEFARAASLSVKALRLYHDMGLLVPAVVDPVTGYRAYSPNQLTPAAIIRLLREVGVSLQDIHNILHSRDLGLMRKVLAEQADRFQAGLDAVTRLVDDVAFDDTQTDPSEIGIRHEPAHTVLTIEGSPELPSLGPFLLRANATLQEAAHISGAVIEGCFGACYPPQIDDDRQDVTAYLPISAPVFVTDRFISDGVRVDELPPCSVAALEHHGPYWELESCYRRLGTWVAFRAIAAEAPVRERYPTPIDGPPEDAITELQWPVTAESPPL